MKGFTIICNACGNKITFQDPEEYYLLKSAIVVIGDTEFNAQIECKCGNHISI